MKRVPTMVFAAEVWTGSTGQGLADGFRKLGWAVQDIDLGRFIGDTGRSLLARAALRVTARWSWDAFRAALIEACELLRPDVFLVVKGMELDAALLAQVKQTGARLVNFYPDFHFSHPGLSYAAMKSYDLFITTKNFQIDWIHDNFENKRVEFVHHGYSSGVHMPIYNNIDENEYRRDILYIGNYSKYKEDWLAPVHAAFPAPRFQIIGYGWREAVAGRPLAAAVLGKGIIGHPFSQALQLAKINIAVHLGPHPSGWQDLVSTRTFEIPACGGFMLHIDNEEVRGLYKVGEEIDVFSTKEELVDKIGFYLARPELRRRMIARAYERCVPAYSYDARAAEIAAALGIG